MVERIKVLAFFVAGYVGKDVWYGSESAAWHLEGTGPVLDLFRSRWHGKGAHDSPYVWLAMFRLSLIPGSTLMP